MAVKMSVVGIAIDPTNNSPIVILRDREGEVTLPIWIGILEASSIATQLEKVALARPMTHDLFVGLLEKMGTKIERILVNDLRNNTYFATLFFSDEHGNEFTMDARPSDSIALALRLGANIFVEETVLEKASKLDEEMIENLKKSMDKKWDEILGGIDPDDLGKYRM